MKHDVGLLTKHERAAVERLARQRVAAVEINRTVLLNTRRITRGIEAGSREKTVRAACRHVQRAAAGNRGAAARGVKRVA